MGLFAGQKWCILEILETRFLATTWVLGVLQCAPKACPVKYNGLECWGLGHGGQRQLRVQMPSAFNFCSRPLPEKQQTNPFELQTACKGSELCFSFWLGQSSASRNSLF